MDALARAGSNYSVDGNARICSRHFLSSDFCEINGKRQLKWDAIPSLHLLEQAANGNGVLFPASKAVSSGKKTRQGFRTPFTNINAVESTHGLRNSSSNIDSLPNPAFVLHTRKRSRASFFNISNALGNDILPKSIEVSASDKLNDAKR